MLRVFSEPIDRLGSGENGALASRIGKTILWETSC